MNRPSHNILFIYLAVGALCGCPAEAEDKEAMHQTALASRDAYWQCLAEDSVKALGSTVSATDFKLLLEGACPDQKKSFRIKMTDYLAVMHPGLPMQDYLSQSDYAITAAQADAVKFFIKQRSGIK